MQDIGASRNILPSVGSIACYALFAVFVGYEIKEESRDLFSSETKQHPDSKDFGDGCGKYIFWNKHAKGDTLKTLVKKIKTLASHDILPTWRRSLVLAVLATTILIIVIHKKMIPFPLFFLYVIIIFAIFYYSFNYYQYHYYDHAQENLDYNLEVLSRKYKSLLKKTRKDSKTSKFKKRNEKKK